MKGSPCSAREARGSCCIPMAPGSEWVRPEPLEPPVVLAVGPERGWTEAETGLFVSRGFSKASMGNRILRTETAALAASALALARLGLA